MAGTEGEVPHLLGRYRQCWVGGGVWLLVSQHYMFLLIRSCDMDLSEGEEGEVNLYLFSSN